MKHITKVRELYEETIHWISESEDSWKNFLSCMGRLYQLDFLNTCMVYAQRPDASVLAGYDAWLEMDLPVARGSKGIAVFPSKIFGEGVTHVYDIQDVKGQGIRPWNWQVNGTNRRLLPLSRLAFSKSNFFQEGRYLLHGQNSASFPNFICRPFLAAHIHLLHTLLRSYRMTLLPVVSLP